MVTFYAEISIASIIASITT